MDQQNQAPVQTTEKKSFGPLIGIVVIVIALAVGAFYVWGGKISSTENSAATDSTATSTATTTVQVVEVNVAATTSTSTR